MEKLYIGSHVGMGGPDYFLGSCKTALSWGENTFMFYTGAPQNSFRIPLSNCKIPEGLKFLKDNNIDISKVIVHAPYIINLANTIDSSKFDFAIDVLVKELQRTYAFGPKTLVLHPGSAVGGDSKEGLNKVVEGLNIALSKDGTDVVIAIETMAGKGHEVGINFDEVAFILNNCKYPNRLGVCLDTCHINDAGYNVSDIDTILKEFDEKIGLNKLKVIHLNDSQNVQGAHKDRHENIGFGSIGFDTLVKYVFDERLDGIPKILETPYVGKFPPYKLEIEMIKAKKMNLNLKDEVLNS